MAQDALEDRVARLEQQIEGLQKVVRQLAAWEGCAVDIPGPDSSREHRAVARAPIPQADIVPTAARNGASERERS
jgi:hypothetical protein